MGINLSIKNVPDALASQLKARAEANHRSLQGELMAMLERSLSDTGAAQARAQYAVPGKGMQAVDGSEQSLRGLIARISEAHAVDTVSLIRGMREDRTEHLMRLIEREGAAARARNLLGLPPLDTNGPGASAAAHERNTTARRKTGKSAKR